jgi:ubiquinone/menaquinone biosynthesis C-methylase UbiE
MTSDADKRRPWYDSAFAADYLERYGHRSDELALAEFPFVRRVLKLRPGMSILDLCCGAGRHARAFSATGCDVVGLDRSPDLLRVAHRRHREGTGTLTYVRADMRALPFPAGSFDSVASLFTSFGYFSTDAVNQRVLNEVARVLKPGAPFLLDFMNIGVVRRTLQPRSERVVGATRLKERRWFDARTRRLNKVILADGPAGRRRLRESVRAYEPRELGAMFRRAGLVVVRRYGDLKGAAFNPRTSLRCVLLARKAQA